MKAADIQRLAGRGEGPTLEFKLRTPEAMRLAKEVIAFANTNGGRVLIGVDDDGSVVGVKDAIEEEFSFRQALESHCSPPVRWRMERVEITRKRDVIVLAIPRSRHRPHFVIVADGSEVAVAYVRVGDRSLEASPAAVDLMLSDTNPKDVQFEFGDTEIRLMKYLEEYGRVTIEFFSRFAGLDEIKARSILVDLTKAGVLSHHLDFNHEYFTMSYVGEN